VGAPPLLAGALIGPASIAGWDGDTLAGWPRRGAKEPSQMRRGRPTYTF